MSEIHEAVAAPKKPASAGLSLGSLALILLYPLVVTGLGGVWANQKAEEKVMVQALKSPPVVVVDDLSLIKLAIDNGANRYHAREVSAEIARIVQNAGMGDSIVLSKSMILYAPDSNEVRVRNAQPDLQRGLE